MKCISFPSKTFLIGEYAVLKGYPCVIVNTKPRFKFLITKKTKNLKSVFHPQSPAAQWLKKFPKINQSYFIKCNDPYSGQGGFGLSSAEFNVAYLLSQNFTQGEIFKMWQAYRSLKFQGIKPSGADIVSQWVGGMCLFSLNPFNVESMKWNFVDLDFFLIRTGYSLNTWEHLDTLSGNNFFDLGELATQAITYVKQSDTKSFIKVINQYAKSLQKQKLVHSKTSLLLDKIKLHKFIVAAKGCGAMGAEVIAVFFNPKNKQEVIHSLQKIVAHSSDLTSGIKIHKSIVINKL